MPFDMTVSMDNKTLFAGGRKAQILVVDIETKS
jgi:hypothetical protein